MFNRKPDRMLRRRENEGKENRSLLASDSFLNTRYCHY
jgi:hypothetical protein